MVDVIVIRVGRIEDNATNGNLSENDSGGREKKK